MELLIKVNKPPKKYHICNIYQADHNNSRTSNAKYSKRSTLKSEKFQYWRHHQQVKITTINSNSHSQKILFDEKNNIYLKSANLLIL